MITLYSTPNCVQCEMTKEFLIQHNLEFIEINAFEHKKMASLIKGNVYRTLPVVEVILDYIYPDELWWDVWCGFQADRLEEIYRWESLYK